MVRGNRGKCIFNDDLRKKHPHMRKGSNSSEVICEVCGACLDISNDGKTGIEKHLTRQKHLKALRSRAQNGQQGQQKLKFTFDPQQAAMEGTWAYHIVESN